MSGKETRKSPRSRPNPNLKLLDVLQQQAQIRCFRKTSVKASVKKKTDQKMLIQQFRNHIDEYPIMLRQKETEPVVYNTTLSITKSNNECQSQGRRTTTGLPRRQPRYELQQSRRKQSFSICTYEPNDPDRSIKSNSRSQTKNRGRNIYESDKENRQVQGRHSLIERRHTRSHFNAHASCNDEQRSKSRKSTTPISMARHRNRNNASCMDHIGTNYQTISLEKEKRHQRRGTCQLAKQSGKPSKKELKKPKTSKKQSQRKKSNEKDKSKIIKNRPSVPTLTTMPKAQATKKRKPSAQLDRSSDEDDYDYPISKYINTKKKKSQSNQASQKLSILTNDLCKKILTQSSLIKSSVQTSKKSEMGRGSLYDFDYVQRITQLEEEGTSIKKRKPTKEQEPLVLDEKHSFQFNLQEVRLFERRKRQQKQRRERLRRPIFQQIQEQYPQLNEQEVRFLVSVIFIQRFWRERKLQKELMQQFNYRSQRESGKNSPERKVEVEQPSHLDVSPVMNQAPILEPLYDLLVQHKKNPQIEDGQNNIRSSRRQLNPLQKYSQYFKKLEAVPTDPTDLQPTLSAEPIAYPPLQVSKPNFKKIKKAQPVEVVEQKQVEIVNPLPYGGSITERSLSNTSFNCQKQVFPPLDMVNSRRHVLLQQHAEHLTHLDQLYLMQQIDTERYKEKKNILEESLKKQLSQIKHDNKDIQKGYLKYIDFLRKIKGDSKSRCKSRLRRVNSQDGYMSRVYSRFCSIQTFSNDSESLKELKERLLVRRQIVRSREESSSSRQGALITLRRNLSRQQLLLNNQHYISGGISPRQPSPKQPIDMSQKIKIDEGESFCQDQGSSGNFHIRDCNQQNEQVDIIRETFRQDSQPQVSFTVRQFNLQPFEEGLIINSRNSPERGNTVPASPMINLNEFLSRVKEETSRSSSSIIGQLTEEDESQSSHGHSSLHLDLSLKRQQNSILLAEHVFQLLITQLCQETKKARGLDKKIRSKLEKRKKRLPAINTEPSGVADYADSLIKFLKVSRFGSEVLNNFNTVLGYAPINFLRMLRDPQFIPPEQYVQIIPDECYMELEEVQFSRLLPQTTDPKFSNFLKGISSVHNRAIFECVKIQLLRLKPYGQEGLPYPWDPEPVFNKQPINQHQFYEKLQSVKSRLVDSSHCQCGIILQRYTVRTAEQLEKVHDDNQDRLLEVLEAEVRDDGSWNFINMQLLQTRMDIDVEVFHWIVDEAFDEIKRVFGRR